MSLTAVAARTSHASHKNSTSHVSPQPHVERYSYTEKSLSPNSPATRVQVHRPSPPAVRIHAYTHSGKKTRVIFHPNKESSRTAYLRTEFLKQRNKALSFCIHIYLHTTTVVHTRSAAGSRSTAGDTSTALPRCVNETRACMHACTHACVYEMDEERLRVMTSGAPGEKIEALPKSRGGDMHISRG